VLFITLVKRFAYVSLAALVAIAYLLALLGPILHAARGVLSSPFYYLRLVPAQAPNWGAIVVCSCIGLVVGAGGFYRFSRADLGKLTPGRCVLFGCMRMPASMRTDAAFM